MVHNVDAVHAYRRLGFAVEAEDVKDIGAGFIMADCHLVAYRAAGLNPVAIASRTVSRAAEVAGSADAS